MLRTTNLSTCYIQVVKAKTVCGISNLFFDSKWNNFSPGIRRTRHQRANNKVTVVTNVTMTNGATTNTTAVVENVNHSTEITASSSIGNRNSRPSTGIDICCSPSYEYQSETSESSCKEDNDHEDEQQCYNELDMSETCVVPSANANANPNTEFRIGKTERGKPKLCLNGYFYPI